MAHEQVQPGGVPPVFPVPDGKRGYVRKEAGSNPFLQQAVGILHRKAQEVAKENHFTDPSTIYDSRYCMDVADKAVVQEMRAAGYGAHLMQSLTMYYVPLHQYIRIDNPKDPNDPYCLDATWQQFQPRSEHKEDDPPIMAVTLSQLPAFLQAHGIQDAPSQDAVEQYPGLQYGNWGLGDFGHLPWIAVADVEVMEARDDAGEY
ncbi:MAG: hypothetical protein KGJ07_00445 [Patescibacteria group bacterium]|nr:hypothetical protein [Patescibacteria group bacterium]